MPDEAARRRARREISAAKVRLGDQVGVQRARGSSIITRRFRRVVAVLAAASTDDN